MAMLAEPRRKQKVINLRAKNNAWSNDTNKFGQRMLEKMGWSSGKGLGAKENGIVEHVIAKYKNDDKGLGYEDKNDQWTKHEDDFNALLANLSSDKAETKEVMHSGVSLEVKSKKSKARIHYHKFTRGKDLSRYSEKDLANIFGKKSFKEEITNEIDKEEIKSSEQVFTEKGSMEDYFKSKMAALKTKSTIEYAFPDENNDTQDFVFQGFSTMRDNEECALENKETFSFYKNSGESQEVQENTEPFSKKSKKKKSKKKDTIDLENVEVMDHTPSSCYNAHNENNIHCSLLKENKKKKKSKDSEFDQNTTLDENNKKKKKKKDKQIIGDSEPIGDNEKDDYIPQKKKKKKNK